MKRLLPLVFVAIVTRGFAVDSIPPVGADGKPLNLGFEDGTLRDWTAAGEAFAKQPVKGEIDQNRPLGRGKVSNHKGEFWIGGYEILRDLPKGMLTSVAFKVSQPWASFLIGGGSLPGTRVEIVTKDDGKVIHTARGVNNETMARSVVDLRKLQGREIFIRIVDEETVGWGHVNFDDFIFHAEEPKFSPAELAKVAPVNKGDPNLKPDEVEFAGLPAEKAAQVATVPAGYELKVFAAEPDIINPIAFCMDDRARVWVVEGMTYPQRAKTEPGAPEWLGGKDRILVFEDTDGDGHFDKRTVFMEGLNLVSGIEVGFGGVFVGAAPNLIFIPVENWDEPKPAGPAEVLLNGWGYQDTHETLNTFHWGPDGWLYGCHGVFTHSEVGKPGTGQKEIVANSPEGKIAKQLRDGLTLLENERRKAEDAMTALTKDKEIGYLKEDRNSGAQYLMESAVRLAAARDELQALAPKLNVPENKTRSEALREEIGKLGESITLWEGKVDAWGKTVSQWETLQANVGKTRAEIDRVKGILKEMDAAKNGEREPEAQRVKLNAGIWRWQPQRKEFEVFAHGTSNPWGIDWNADGDLFAEACVIPHLFHIIQGARYQRQAGQHFDPHTYDDIKTIADHRHFLGATPHAGNGRSDAAGGGHAHAGLCIPQHPSWPDGIRGNVLMNNIHGARINMDVLERKGSGYVAHHGADFINFHDKASQIVDLREGPDGTLWMIDWYDVNQCHNPRREAHDYTTGRIFRLGRKGHTMAREKLELADTSALVFRSVGGDEWTARQSRRLLQERNINYGEVANQGVPIAEVFHVMDQTGANIRGHQLEVFTRGLRAYLSFGAASDPRSLFVSDMGAIRSPSALVAGYIHNLGGGRTNGERETSLFASYLRQSGSPIVRLSIASACQRLTVEQRKPIVLALLAHEEDADDANLPLMDWYAAEPIVAADPAWAAEALGACKIPKVAEFIARRMAEK